MMARVLVGLALSASLIACSSRTTSLGGPSGNNASANVTEPENEVDVTTRDAGGDARASGKGMTACHGYAWEPEPSELPCEYRLPPSDPPQNDDPYLAPNNWGPNPMHVIITTIVVGDWNDGLFVGRSENCGSGDGWHYVEPGDGGLPSLFAICPKSCAAVTNGALLRLTASTYCE